MSCLHPHLPGFMEAALFSDSMVVVTVYQTTLCYIPEARNLHVDPCEKRRRHVSTMKVWAVWSSELSGGQAVRYITCYVVKSCKSHTGGIRTSDTTFRYRRRSNFLWTVYVHLQSTGRLNSPKREPQLLYFCFEVSSSR